MTDLFSPFRIGTLDLPSRIALAPMTRSRASVDGIASPLAVEYYAQRASAGLLITEGSQISAQGTGYIRTPGIYTDEMVQGWKAVTEAVHEKGGRIFLQLWHVGRVSHPDFHGGALPVAPSAIGFDGDAFTPEGPKKIVTPRALEVSELPGIVEDFAKGAANAIAAGFDGVEIHGANGYLLDQFMRDGSNQREDAYGGSVENRLRFPLEVTDAVVAEVGRDKVGFRINPANIPPMGTFDSDPAALFGQLAQALSQRELAYLHVFEPGAAEFYTSQSGDIPAPLTPQLRAKFNGPLIANGGHGKDSATEMLAKGDADLIAFGSSFLANPDLPRRLAENIALNTPNRETFYQGEAVGYTDYPVAGAT